MKSSLKRVFSVLLVAAMLLGVSVTSFAAENPATGEVQSILRELARPITNITLKEKRWDNTEKCYYFVIREEGIGPGTVKLNNTTLSAYKREPLYEGFDRTEVIGWDIYYKSPRIYSAGTYRLVAAFVSTNGGSQPVWTLKRDLEVTEDMLQ